MSTNIQKNLLSSIPQEDFLAHRNIRSNDIQAVRRSGKLLCRTMKLDRYAEKIE